MNKMSIVLAIALFATGASAHAQKAACDAVVAKQAWAKCSSCHIADPGAPSTLGPNLSGVIGRKAGTLPGFHYSPAMQKFGKTWTRAQFEEFVTAPQSVVPGTRMAFAGLKNPAERVALSCALQKGKP